MLYQTMLVSVESINLLFMCDLGTSIGGIRRGQPWVEEGRGRRSAPSAEGHRHPAAAAVSMGLASPVGRSARSAVMA